MKSVVDTKIFAGLLSAANGIAGRDTSIQIRATLPDPAMRVGKIRVTAYDQSTICAWECPAQIMAEGSVALRGAALERFLKVSFRSDPTVVIEAKPTNAHPALLVHTARGMHEFETLSDAVFEGIDPGRIDRPNGDISALARAITRARSACASPDQVTAGNVVLSGVHISLQGHEIHVVGTDGHRLAWSALLVADHPSVAFEPSPTGYTIPGPLAAKITHMIENSPARIDIKQDALVVANDAGTLALRLIDGVYPAYQPLLAIQLPHEVLLDKGTFLMALERSSAAIGGSEQSATSTLVRDASGLHLLSATSQESSSETIATQGGADARVGFETSYMRKALSNLPTDDVRIRFGDYTQPIILDHPNRPDVMMLVMPRKTRD